MQVNMTSATSASDPSWYPDTGANVHLTNDLSNLNLNAEEYTSTDQIRVGNGQGLQISHSGVVAYQHPHVISIYSPCFMFLRFRKILFL
jgi:hypothetical protein